MFCAPSTPTPVSALRGHYRSGKAAMIEHFRTARATAPVANRLIREMARHADHTLIGLWEHAQMPPGAALLAVGGYGRGELFPYSDVDVVVLLATPNYANGVWSLAGASNAAARSSVEGFITACWDVGLEIGSSVRTVDECIAEGQRDLTVQTALLEARYVCGSRRVFTTFRHANTAAMDPKAFLRAKTLEMRRRHTKFEDTPYSLEPNCKESPGGLRDLHTVVWVTRAAGLGKNWNQMEAKGLITPFEVKQLQRNAGVLMLIRARLHMVAGRREDRLVFDLQTAVAESFGYRASKTARASEVLMRRYYWAAKAVAQLNQILMLNIDERINGSTEAHMRPINARFFDRGGMVEVASDDLYQRVPNAILETFLVFQRTPGIKGLSARTLRALYNAREVMDRDFRKDPTNRTLFLKILQAPQGQTHALRLMNQSSVLGRYLWVFRRIVGQMQHDLYHVYTVDQHIIMVLRNVRRFLIHEHAHEYPFCSQLASRFDRPWVLYVAALFHDVAKGRGGDHSDLGAVEARRFCCDHGIGQEDSTLIEFLVQNHLTMSHVAQKEDLSDPDVISSFTSLASSERRLTALYLLTVADIRGTSPKVWNAWKGKLLEDLYHLSMRALGGAKLNLDTEIEARKSVARKLTSLPLGVEAPLWNTLELSYFARHDADDIAWHAQALHQHVNAKQPIIKVRPSSLGEGLQVVVYAPDRPDMFARICGHFDAAGFDVLDAKVHTTRTGYAVDTFQITVPLLDDEDEGGVDDLILRIEAELAFALESQAPLPDPRSGRVSRRVKSFPMTPRVTLRPDERAQRWILSISSSDYPGLLYAIANVLVRHNINLELAKITTLGERVEDTLLIDGSALQHNKTQIEIENELFDTLSA